MVKKIQAFFTTENDAESAVARIQKYTVSNVVIDVIIEEGNDLKLVPVANSGISGAGIGIPNRTDASSHGLMKKALDLVRKDVKKDESKVTHVLEFDILEEEVDEVINELKESKALMDSDILDVSKEG